MTCIWKKKKGVWEGFLEDKKLCHICLKVDMTKSNDALDLCYDCFDNVARLHKEYLEEEKNEKKEG